ncbi:hypothetical protein [Pseudanabaena sp. FACHB-2040]|uniref:hypothetical protein n=1 Tax=Pseudanabaena sp. FACHB-2040 TaxID=2692859 RepID=UPI001683D270|nr:hypothetical protein [Pseudanabaena sp. FACHB-2040]MBD2261411.1 hypothetical protein [Pseudanabaena sp. FACHB-2040]
MAKGFGKEQQSDQIWVESLVKSRTLQPAINLKWGKQQAQLTPQEATHHALAVLEAAAAAELDSALMRWAVEVAGSSPVQGAQLLQLFRQQREAGQIPSCTMDLGDESIRPDTARERAKYLLMNAFNTEVEAFLLVFAIQDLGLAAEQADQMLQEFRALRGLQTDWNREGLRGDGDE